MAIVIKRNGQELPKKKSNPVVEEPDLVIKNLLEEKPKVIKKAKVKTKASVKDEDGKFSMSYSRLRSYIICPKRFELHSKYGWNPTDETKKVLRGGKIFEAVVFGDKNCILEGANSAADLRVIKKAKQFALNDLFGVGEAYFDIKFENDLFKARGEIDFIGEFKFSNGRRKGIIDLKWTGKIDYIWQGFKYKEDALQVIMYSWMHWKETGEMLDAAYVIVESTYDDPVFLVKEVFINEKTYQWLEDFLYRVALEPIKVTNPSTKNCLGGKGTGRCPWLEYCKSGRLLLGGMETYDANLLSSKTENNINF